MNKITTEDIMYMKDQIIKFNVLMGNDINNKGLIETYHALTNEEFGSENEFYQSFLNHDKDGILDGLIDICFTSIYWYLLEGYTFKEEYIARLITVEADMTSLRTDILDLKMLIDQGLAYYTVNTLIRILSKTEIQEQFNIRGAFDNILESNLSKVVPKGSVSEFDEVTSIESKGRYKGITVHSIEYKGEKFVAFKAKEDIQNGVKFKEPKLIKTSLFKEPCLDKFIY